MTSTQPPKALILSGVDQEQLQREFAKKFPPKKGQLIARAMQQLQPKWNAMVKEAIQKAVSESAKQLLGDYTRRYNKAVQHSSSDTVNDDSTNQRGTRTRTGKGNS